MLSGIFVVFVRKFEDIFHTPFSLHFFFESCCGTEIMVGIAILRVVSYCGSIVEFNLCINWIR
jgi:hypothetical protein